MFRLARSGRENLKISNYNTNIYRAWQGCMLCKNPYNLVPVNEYRLYCSNDLIECLVKFMFTLNTKISL